MNLSNFEDHIDKKILTRGLGYFRFSRVSFLEKVGEYLYKAEVEGTEIYYVEVELDSQSNILFSECDCPYNVTGEYCKHLTAVFYALKKMSDEKSAKIKTNKTDKTEGDTSSISSPARPGSFKTGNKKEESLNIKKMLSARSKIELIEFLDSLARESEEIKKRIELSFGTESDEKEIESCLKLIQAYIRKHSNSHGLVDYRDVYGAIQGAELVLEKARDIYIENELARALELTLCIIHEMLQLLKHSDDTDGIIDSMVDDSIFLIDDIIQDLDNVSPERSIIFYKLLEESSHPRYDGWPDLKISFLDNCSFFADNTDLRNILDQHLQDLLDKDMRSTWSNNYFTEQISFIRYNIIHKYQGSSKAQKFLHSNLHYPAFRKMAVQQAMKNCDYEQVETLAQEGEKTDKNLPGLLKQWRKMRYEAYKTSNQLEKQRKLAEEFILEGHYKYYKELKKTYDKNEWEHVYPRIISTLEYKNVHTHRNIYTRVLIEEGEKEKLLKHVRENPAKIEKYWKELVADYREEVYAMFSRLIEKKASTAGNGKDYQEVCHIIRLLKTAGGHDQAGQAIQKLIGKYPQKAAFKDELLKI